MAQLFSTGDISGLEARLLIQFTSIFGKPEWVQKLKNDKEKVSKIGK